ncbi:MAG: arsenate reductase ArsC [Candidatus Acidiferrales bacterium]
MLFVCSGNRARSQMAEGLARRLAPRGVEVFSAGTHPHPQGVHPMAIEVMRERGVDISHHHPKSLAVLPGEFDYVITLCAEADAECPTLPARRERLAWHLADPALVAGEQERTAFAEARDCIEALLRELFSKSPFAA